MEVKYQKKGQVTIFIIISILIVILGILIFMFYPQIQGVFGIGETSPQVFLQNCLEEDLFETINLISLQGGSIEPENYYQYDGYNIEYLCYTEDYYLTCYVQQPLLKKHVEEQIHENIQEKINECFDLLEDNFVSKGYGFDLRRGDNLIEMLPERIILRFNDQLTLTRDSTSTYNDLAVVLNNNLYELVSIADSIISWESEYGDSETTIYMNYYRDLKVEKKKQTDGTTIYILTDRNDESKFQFASRSVAWPPGY